MWVDSAKKKKKKKLEGAMTEVERKPGMGFIEAKLKTKSHFVLGIRK